MTQEMKELIDRELDAALESGDAKLIDRAVINAHKAVADCQLKTAERVKIIAETTNSAPARLNAARQRLLKTKTDEANGVVSNVTVNVTAGR